MEQSTGSELKVIEVLDDDDDDDGDGSDKDDDIGGNCHQQLHETLGRQKRLMRSKRHRNTGISNLDENDADHEELSVKCREESGTKKHGEQVSHENQIGCENDNDNDFIDKEGGAFQKREQRRDKQRLSKIEALRQCEKRNDADEQLETLRDKLLEFQHQGHSLRLSASNLAAMAGLHPYKNLVELTLELVYQGRMGQALLERDAKLLGLSLVNSNDVLEELAVKAGPEARAALQSALQVKEGSHKLDSIEHASLLKESFVKEAKKAVANGKLRPDELQVLQEGVRTAVNTGYGTAHEDNALDYYEKLVGWDVRERNAEIRVWDFCLQTQHEQGDESSSTVAVPMGKAKPIIYQSRRKKEEKEKDRPEIIEIDGEDYDEKVGGEKESEKDLKSFEISNTPGLHNDKEIKPFFSIAGSIDGIREELAPSDPKMTSMTQKSDDNKFADNNGDNCNDDDGWAIRRVVVECKHRMRRIHPTPPLYEQIQAVVYCFMYDAEEADIVQVLRQQQRRPRKQHPQQQNPQKKQKQQQQSGQMRGKVTEATATATTAETVGTVRGENGDQHVATLKENMTPLSSPKAKQKEPLVVDAKQRTLDQWVKRSPSSPKSKSKDAPTVLPTSLSVSIDEGTKSNVPQKQYNSLEVQQQQHQALPPRLPPKEAAPPSSPPPPTLHISRVSLDDTVMQHRFQWSETVLPRLKSFVEAVYAIRRDDDKRYRFLIASAAATEAGASHGGDRTKDSVPVAWKMLFDECPWLRNCDTAFHRLDFS